MSMQLSHQEIQRLCGVTSYRKGEKYRRSGKVLFTHADSRLPLYKATVQVNGGFDVIVKRNEEGKTAAQCTCPALSSYDSYCSHVAAVLLEILLHEADVSMGPPKQSGAGKGNVEIAAEKESAVSREADSAAIAAVEEEQLTSAVLALFGGKPRRPSGTRTQFDTREPLEASFIVTPQQHRGGLMFGIELKVGPQPNKLYVVPKLYSLLDAVERRETYSFSKYFTYDPEQYRFPQRTDAVIQELIRLGGSDRIHANTMEAGYMPNRDRAPMSANDRIMLITPAGWETLLPKLVETPDVQLIVHSIAYNGLELTDEPLPLRFTFEEEAVENVYRRRRTHPTGSSPDMPFFHLHVEGLDAVTVMDAYSFAIIEGKLHKLTETQSKQLAQLQSLLGRTNGSRFRISPSQMEAFMERVVPGLMKLGGVHIATSVSEKVVHTPLKAKLYLDRVHDRLLAALEFHYGDIVISPLEGAEQRNGHQRIIMRDGEREQRILELMGQADFMATEGGYMMSGDDAEYEFLYHIVPELEKLLDVYATSAVKTRIAVGVGAPTVKADVDVRTDWLEFRFELDGIPERDIKKVLQAIEEKRRYYRLPDGSLAPLEGEEFAEIARLMNLLGVRYSELIDARIRVPSVRSLRLLDIDVEGRAVKLGRSLRQLLYNMRHPDSLNFPVPEELTAVLRDYQTIGYQWMRTLAHYRFGGILADDMGLGKTVQSIAFLLSMLPEIREQRLPSLIVCPASLMYNWQQELHRFAPSIRAVIAAGTKPERERNMLSPEADVIITSYPILRRDAKLYAPLAFHTLILDEAQYIKNYTTQTAQAVKQLQAKYRFGLTGTPIENRLEELWSIYNAVFPALFPSRQRFHELTRESVAKRTRPFLLRRLKKDVLKELPDKIETLQSSELLPEQKKLYAAYLAQLRMETLKHLDDRELDRNRIKILAGITRLRQICCHPALFVEGYRGSSAKLEQLLDIVEDCRNAGKRMLVFSQFTGMLELIRRELGVRGVPLFYLDGSTPPQERAELCARFNRGEKELFLISMKAGGTGLNLTGADTVILYDLWWNPAVEQQATDRAHRIGQRNVVQVIRLAARGTVEDKMYELQQRKMQLIDEVIQPGEQPLSSMTEEDIREILQL
ncbi:DEAD/DEAH box helicase [Paenibacillus xylaniclasticus]|uniref:DEAD/DEAH box helicase n=1 Tax=Paenibacillus xylaniclasticus TaxID=588083 RepID=UPI000FDC27FD|nr:DEAD/DEAH box helicase [Paenibacillus xylaniclasticus]